MTGADGRSSLLYPPNCENCSANGVVANLTPEILRALVEATTVDVVAFGVTAHLSIQDRAALGEFATQIGLGR